MIDIHECGWLINTSVAECESSLFHVHSADWLRNVLEAMDAEGIADKMRRKAIARRIRKLERQTKGA